MLARLRTPLLIVLPALVAGVLFPFGWLGDQWPAFGRLLGAVFPTDGAHWVGHAAIFALLAWCALAAWPALLRRPGLFLALLMAGGASQELLQRSYKGLAIRGDDLIDLAVDVAAGMIVYAAFRWLAHTRHPERPPDPPADL